MQNCLRCHRAGNIGGGKSPFEWPQMALIAQGNAAAFGKYVVRPIGESGGHDAGESGVRCGDDRSADGILPSFGPRRVSDR